MSPIVEIDMDTLTAIAHYYEFPSAVFFLPEEEWEKKKDTTRIKELNKEVEILDKIREILYVPETPKEPDEEGEQ